MNSKLKKLIIFNKPLGATPLESVNLFKKNHPSYKNQKIGYAGRLDPMAQGALLLLIGNENKKINKYLWLDKEYTAVFLFGFRTDSHDLLGIARKNGKKPDLNSIKNLTGAKNQKIPFFSSFRIKGKPLFWYALHNKKIKNPIRKIKIKSVQIISISKTKSNKLLKKIANRINKVKGNFRQDKIKIRWKSFLIKDNSSYTLIKLKIKCSSGTYIRSIAEKLGATLFSLKRTKIGKFKLSSKSKV